MTRAYRLPQASAKRIPSLSCQASPGMAKRTARWKTSWSESESAPFYILDEVEAALDDTNLRRLAAYIDSLRGQTQLIMITHQRRTMEIADTLFGVSMQGDGVTKVISQKLDQALKHAE